MLISTKHLRAAGLSVRVTENGLETKREVMVEINFEHGHRLSNQVHDEIDEAVGPEFADAVYEGLAAKIHTLQVTEAIRKTEGKAWRDRNHKDDLARPIGK